MHALLQGLDWYRGTLVKDQDGDVAHEFLEEPAGAAGPVRRDSLSPDHKRQKTTLQVGGAACALISC